VLAPPRPIKRLIELVLASALLIVISPILLLLSLLVAITSRGPVFYLDNRFGLGGEVYRMFKFRSMKVGAPPLLTSEGKLIVAKRDPRLTVIGGPMRALRIDELPQLINVVKGDMSFVGPRAGQPWYEKHYTGLAYERLKVRPGITGLASVVGGRQISNESLYKLDKRYVDRQDARLDLLIVLMTPVYVLRGPSLPRRVLARYLEGISMKELDSLDG
jgi:lipopolysaccharide/colanic/teichoic acid biosynthesis glycosyltransferase